MDLDALKQAIQALPAPQRKELAIYLTHLELVDDSQYFETLRQRMNDQLDQSWIDIEEL
ncbi:hypothetical protein [Rubritalea tangerina]|uniref:DUF2281 domain-containing protein n=1 Tax=Rubritalea tangerina TaxID=430798 RepID=A0ABW4Z6G9_9BACT